MRQDIKVLLGRIGEETFNYYDFETPSLEIDIWPIFEALLLDERVVGRVDTKIFARVALEPSDDLPRMVEPVPQARPAPARPPRRPESAGMFGSYGARAAESSGETVRSMLARLASSAG